MRRHRFRVTHLPLQVSYLGAVSGFFKQNQVMRVQTYSSQAFFKNVLYYEHNAGVTMVAFLCKQIDHFLKFVHQVVEYTNFAFISSYALCHSE